jgi:hypothetical protein
MKKSVMYTPMYDPMYFVGADHDDEEGEQGSGAKASSFVASPTTPKYTPTSPAFLELGVGHNNAPGRWWHPVKGSSGHLTLPLQQQQK